MCRLAANVLPVRGVFLSVRVLSLFRWFWGKFGFGGDFGFWVAWLSVPFILFVWSSSWLWGRLLAYVVVLPFVCSSSRVCGRVLGGVVVVLSLSSFGFGGNLVLGRIWVLGGVAVCLLLFVWSPLCLCGRGGV